MREVEVAVTVRSGIEKMSPIDTSPLRQQAMGHASRSRAGASGRRPMTRSWLARSLAHLVLAGVPFGTLTTLAQDDRQTKAVQVTLCRWKKGRQSVCGLPVHLGRHGSWAGAHPCRWSML